MIASGRGPAERPPLPADGDRRCLAPTRWSAPTTAASAPPSPAARPSPTA